VLGAYLINLGFYRNNFAWIFWGRAVYGLGCEVAIILCATIADRWFSGRMHSFAQGMNRTVAFLGQFLNIYLGTEIFLKTRNVKLSMFLYVAVSYFSLICGVIYCIIDHMTQIKIKKTEAILEKEKNKLLDLIEKDEGHGLAMSLSMSIMQRT
jgi:MFS family permease